MSKPVDIPQASVRIVDQRGFLTPEGQVLLQRMAEALIEQQAVTADHETRIEALEP